MSRFYLSIETPTTLDFEYFQVYVDASVGAWTERFALCERDGIVGSVEVIVDTLEGIVADVEASVVISVDGEDLARYSVDYDEELERMGKQAVDAAFLLVSAIGAYRIWQAKKGPKDAD